MEFFRELQPAKRWPGAEDGKGSGQLARYQEAAAIPNTPDGGSTGLGTGSAGWTGGVPLTGPRSGDVMTARLSHRFRREERPAVLVMTARMGAGHDGVARELSRRLAAHGLDVTTADVWDLQPARTGRLVTGFYRAVVQRFPGLYDLIYRIWLEPPPQRRGPISPVTRSAERRLSAEISRLQPAAIVSTFHLGSQMLGHLRARGALDVPCISYCVDFAAHGLWVNPHLDLNLCLHPDQAERLRSAGARHVRWVGPAVPTHFRADPDQRDAARRRLGVSATERVALVVSGSWGAGRLEDTLDAMARLGRYRVVVLTGQNTSLRRRLRSRYPTTQVLGWVDDMASLLSASDVVIENAGGLTAMEAMACRVPVVSYLPIPGHGRDNVEMMAEAGVSSYARTEEQLGELLEALVEDSPLRRRQVLAACSMWRQDPAWEVLRLVRGAVRLRPAQ